MTTDTRGFTIIEVMLFLAITGMLFAALMVGVNTNVTQQRYLDSVRSFRALVQNEFSEAANTLNQNGAGSNNTEYKCNEAGQDVAVGSPRDDRGTSRCVILGRAIQIKNGGQDVVTSSVTGYKTETTDKNDIDAIKAYVPKLGSFDAQTRNLDWGSYLQSVSFDAGSNATLEGASAAVILIVRSPATGLLRVFTSQSGLGNTTDLSAIVSENNSSDMARIRNCIAGDSGLLPKQLLTIDPRIASPDAVTVDGGENDICQ